MIPVLLSCARRAVAALFLCGAAAVLAQAPIGAPPPGLAPNDPAERLSGYLRTLAGDPADVVALNGAGRAALEIGDVNGALGFYGRATQAAPQNGDAKAGLAAALVQLEQPRRALPLFAQAVQLGVPTATIAADRGLAYDLIGDGASAQRDYAAAMAARDSDETRRRYALSLGIAGQRDKALDLLDPLVRRRDPAGWRARAFVLALSGDTAGASSIVQVMMPSQSAAMAPFLGELARLNPAQKAAAVNFGDMPAAGAPGGAGTQLAARDATPLPNPVPRPASTPTSAPVFLPVVPPAPAPARPITRPVEASPPPQRPAPMFVTPAPAPVAVARVDATAPLPAPTVPLRAAPVTRAATQPQPQPVAPAPLPAAPPTPASVPDRTAAIVPSSAPPAEVRPAVAGVPAATPAGVFIGPPAPALAVAAASAPPPLPQPAPSPSIATVALPPARIAPPPPERLALAETPHVDRAAPAVVEPDRVGPFRTVAKTEIDRQRTQLAAASPPAARTLKADDAAESREGEGSLGKAAAKTKAGRHDDAASAHERSKPKEAEPDDDTSARHASRGAKTTDDDAKSTRSKRKPDRSDDADTAPSKSGKAKTGTTADDEDSATSRSAAKSKHTKAADDSDVKPATKKAKDEEDASAKGGRVYVQVAGGANKDDLPKAWAQVKGKAPALLKGKTPSTTPLRFTNRLLVGPFKDADEAQGFVNKLAGKGLSGSVFKSDKGQKIEKVPAAK